MKFKQIKTLPTQCKKKLQKVYMYIVHVYRFPRGDGWALWGGGCYTVYNTGALCKFQYVEKHFFSFLP